MKLTIIIFTVMLIPIEILSYPVYGTKRYGRTPVHAWASPVQIPSYYYLPRTHYPLNYYDNSYVQEYADEYYLPQESYPMYYPVTRNPKYDFYQALPYYYEERHLPRNGYGYYDDLYSDELKDELQQEEERVQREEALPVGQETWYENNQNDDSIDDINAAFLQNLMLYNDAVANKNYDYNNQQIDPYMQGYNKDLVNWSEELNSQATTDDDDVKELKMLAGEPKKQRNKNKNRATNAEHRLQLFEKGKKAKSTSAEPNDSEGWINYGSKRNTMKNKIDPITNLAYKKQELNQHGSILYKDNSQAFTTRKLNLDRKMATSTQPSVSTTKDTEKVSRGGQKEVVLMRPATPVRRPFSEPVMELLAKQNEVERKRTPTVYETIKRLLEMEKSLEKVSVSKYLY